MPISCNGGARVGTTFGRHTRDLVHYKVLLRSFKLSRQVNRVCAFSTHTGEVNAMNNAMATVFYVDDNARSRRLLGRVLAECGFEMITAGDPIEALSRSTKICFDLALLDYQMPSLSGSQLALEMKLLMPDVPIVLLSGYSALPPTELVFVDAHFGHGTHLDDLVDTMRRLTNSKPPRVSRTLEASWSDST
jgi:CheY-like chemotaxis protein